MPSPAANRNPDVMLLIGQLLEAAEAASEGLRSTNAEIQANGKALIAAVKTLELIEETVAELDRLVRTGNGDSLITRLAVLRAEVTVLQTQVGEIETRVRTAGREVGELENARDQLNTGKYVVWQVAQVIGWTATISVALYAALKGN